MASLIVHLKKFFSIIIFQLATYFQVKKILAKKIIIKAFRQCLSKREIKTEPK